MRSGAQSRQYPKHAKKALSGTSWSLFVEDRHRRPSQLSDCPAFVRAFACSVASLVTWVTLWSRPERLLEWSSEAIVIVDHNTQNAGIATHGKFSSDSLLGFPGILRAKHGVNDLSVQHLRVGRITSKSQPQILCNSIP